MRLIASVFIVGAFLFVNLTVAQNTAQPATQPEPKSVTVPITLDHNRVIIDVYVPLSDGSTKRVRGWIDPGDPNLSMSQRVAGWMGLSVHCDGQVCSAKPQSSSASLEVLIGGMKISTAMKEVTVPAANAPIVPGSSAEMKIPSTVLRNYDVMVNFPDREFSIGLPGSLKFKGVKSKMAVNSATGFIQLPGKIDNKSYSLGLDLASSISFLSPELFDKLASAHPDWTRMTGAVGPANTGLSSADEANSKLMRLDRVQLGPLYLTNIPFVEFPTTLKETFAKNSGETLTGVLGAEALANYRIGLDYAHSTVYFDIGSTFRFPDFDVVGLVLRPEADSQFTIIGVADFEGKPSVPDVRPGDHLVAVDGIPTPDSTLGQVWSALEGSIGQERKLIIERAGKQFEVIAIVRHFLGETEEDASRKKPRGKN